MRLIDADALAMKLRHMGYMDENEEVQEVIDRFAEEHGGDLISRQTAIDAIFEICDDNGIENPHVDAIVDKLENLPSAEKTGKWLKYEGRFDYNWECSECGCSAWDKTDYCAYCGAKMEAQDD